MIKKREGELKRQFAQEMKRQLPDFYVLHYATNGAPDREIIGNGISTRWEMKHGTPAFVSPGDQELMCCRLAAVAHCRYVIWTERLGMQKTMIVHPLQVMHRQGWSLVAESVTSGFDHRWLVEQIKQVHSGHCR
jgi:hypothetical protein